MFFSPLQLKWALKNLWRNPRRSLVTGLAIASGYMGLMLFEGYFHRIERTLSTSSFLNQGVGHINIYKKYGLEKLFIKPKKYSLTPEDIQTISGFLKPYKGDISYEAGILVGVGLVGNGCRSVPFLVTGIDRDLQKWLYANTEFTKWATFLKPVKEGKDFALFEKKDTPITITESLALLLNKKTLYKNETSKMKPWVPNHCEEAATLATIRNDTSVQMLAKTLDGGVSAIDAQVTGFFSTGMIYTEDMAINAPLDLVQKLYETDSVSRWLMYLHDEARVSFWKKSIKPDFEKALPQYEMLFYNDARANPFYTGVVEFISGMGGFFTVVIGLVIGLSISNSTTMNLLERSNEIGTLRSLGLTPQHINVLLTQESLWLSLFSLTFGGLAAKGVAFVINRSDITFEPPGSSTRLQLLIQPEVDVGIYLFLFMTFLILVVTYFLARSITNKKVTDLLTST